jgi:crotonobetainyl-CoA:carnitine CoA-transferase CaiB-like acyl-CoA transferase
MADLGADVIKVERPDGGDLCRQLVVADQRVGADSALFHTINRNKRSFAADLKKPRDLALVKQLVARADVMIHNFRPGVMERIGLDHAAVEAINPRIVYGAVTGYGEQGPWRDKPGQDLLVQSLSGMAWLSGPGGDDAPPVPAGLSMVDMTTGAHLLQGILALLLRRGITGRGGRVDVSLLESAMDLQFEPFTAFLNGDGSAPKRSTVNHANVHAAAPYGIYRTADGYLALAMTPMDELARLVQCDALAALAADRDGWYRQRDALKQVLQDHLLSRGTAAWLAVLEPAGVWCADVLTWPRLVQHPGFAAADMVQSLETGGQAMKTTRCPIRVDRQVLRHARPAPAIGEHTREIIEELGLAPAVEQDA